VDPDNTADAPVPGALKATTWPGIGFPFWSTTLTTSGCVNGVLIGTGLLFGGGPEESPLTIWITAGGPGTTWIKDDVVETIVVASLLVSVCPPVVRSIALPVPTPFTNEGGWTI